VHLVKTRRPRDEQILDGDKAICLVRDGRDCLVSWARQRSEDGAGCFADELRDLIYLPAGRGAGQWGRNVLSWLQPAHPGRIVLRYEELIDKPAAAVGRVTKALQLGLQPAATAAIPALLGWAGASGSATSGPGARPGSRPIRSLRAAQRSASMTGRSRRESAKTVLSELVPTVACRKPMTAGVVFG
jgi:Sulfotransferase domain